jgi:hypothetical protein
MPTGNLKVAIAIASDRASNKRIIHAPNGLGQRMDVAIGYTRSF